MSENPDWDAYYIPGTLVLENVAGIRDAVKLAHFERAITSTRAGEIRKNPISGDYDIQHIEAIHKKLFGDVYPFAGNLRNVDMTKRGPDGYTVFTLKEMLPAAGEQLTNTIKSQHYLRGMDKEQFTRAMANVAAQLNILHPFREGNGRTTRAFIEQMAKDAGYTIDFRKIDKKEWQLSVIAAAQGNEGGIWKHRDLQNLKPLQAVIERAAEFAPARAFDRLGPADAIAQFPQLDGAYAAIFEARQKGEDVEAVQSKIRTELHEGRLVQGATPEHSQEAIGIAAEARGLTVRDSAEVTGPQRGEIVATASHHVLLKTADHEAVCFPRASLDSSVHANDKVMIENGKVRDLSLDKPQAEYAVGHPAEVGRLYSGPVFSVSEKYLLQLTPDAGVVRHDRVALSGGKDIAVGDKINVRYPYENVGFVKRDMEGVTGGKQEIGHQRNPGIVREDDKYQSYGRHV